MAAADYRLMTEATGQRIAAALEALSGTGAAAAAARTNLDVYSKGETDTAIAQSTAIDLLWSNSNPYAAFAAQTISLDIMPYRYVIIEFIASSSASWVQSMYAIAFSGDHIVTLELAQSYFRRYYVSGIKVQFDSAYTFNTYGSWVQTEDNTILIPLKIYGVK